MSKSLERLSSGYRINGAADDAAGLAISQAFRADIASFRVASRNASEATSLLRVAEGAMDQIGNMLTRLKELATQAASANAGSNLGKINSEGNALINEIDRIAESTEYADVALVNGSFGVGISTGSSASVAAGVGVNGATGLQALETYTISTAAGTAIGLVNVIITTGNGS
ncbi:MAG: flagellin, partial [Deltaproteobacteria bacterium]|nr:flagellin [Deltaproteobacteria bacterium]